MTGVCQPDAREGQAGPGGESERSIVPLKPGNAGGGKGPWFKTSVESGRTAGRLVMNLQPLLTTVGKLQTALHAKAKAEPDVPLLRCCTTSCIDRTC